MQNAHCVYNRESFLNVFKDIAEKLSELELDQFPDAKFRTSPNAAYICGGIAAMYHGVTSRISVDLDFFMAQSITIYPQVAALYKDANDENVGIVFDTQFRPSLVLLHEDYEERACFIAESKTFRVYVLSPEDLVLTKLSRFGERDRSDIYELIHAGVVRDADTIYNLGMDAIRCSYIGNPRNVEFALKEVCRNIETKHPKPRMCPAAWDLS